MVAKLSANHIRMLQERYKCKVDLYSYLDGPM